MVAHPWHLPAGSTRRGPYDVSVTPASAGWGHSSLHVADLAPGQAVDLSTGPDEVVVLPLRGGCTVSVDGTAHELAGRSGVFAGPSDFAYLPQRTRAVLRSAQGARVALPAARVDEGRPRLPVRRVAASDVAVELRGAGSCSRQVHNFAAAGVFEAHSLIAVEVITPGGNWSSYPPHKHDEASEHESELEEVYYYEIAPGPDGQPGVGYHRTYGTPERPVDVLAEVRTGDTVLVPHGWHGPCAAAPGHHMYYLNVMAGPGAEREWRIVDDPAFAWVRGQWAHQDVDPRLPLHQSTDAVPTAPGGEQR
ncbi:5-deoxy-glucuronate isomerase [Quadrisphaera sp. DSM 44207]|uniref:5-deoxy-glucuronate isomerase n=1 Tax=Quadrisphaera sp. DSM 44207 TaxID=1881057 RepID=UPI000883C808|nr:5-deoxy-glucuronate isomerase [Quadrisphaera sp. DSM 44207]SDQ21827.1 5-deoxyglucuronate isomerase [Quadrisphaera sp. DSM 44207]